MKNCVIIDWFTATTRLWEPTQLIQYLGLEVNSFRATYGMDGYADRLTFGGISVDYHLRANDPEQTNVRLVMSGQGCRQFETSSNVGFMQLFCDVVNGDLDIKRLDIAYDDVDKDGCGLLDLHKIARYTVHKRYVSKWNGGMVIDHFQQNADDALTVQFGSKQSELLLRIYDKAQERGGLDYHWVRSELQLNRERAAGFINQLLKGQTIGELYAGVLRNYLRFIKLDRSRKERCSTVEWWNSFLNNAEAIKIYTPKDIEYNLMRVQQYVINQAGNSIDTYISCVGERQFFSDLENRKSKLNENQKRVIDEYQSAH